MPDRVSGRFSITSITDKGRIGDVSDADDERSLAYDERSLSATFSPLGSPPGENPVAKYVPQEFKTPKTL